MNDNAQNDGALMMVYSTNTDLRAVPDTYGLLDTELLYGEHFRVEERVGRWVRGTAEADLCSGFVLACALKPIRTLPTHQVIVRSTLLYWEPDARTEAPLVAWFGSRLTLGVEQDGFLQAPSDFWVPAAHVVKIGTPVRDFVELAERFVGTPYRYGGRTPNGLDCSALVQLALQGAGVPCPRDSGLQFECLGVPLAAGATLQRGDLAFWPGHVGILVDEHTILHANGYHMATATEPFAEAVRRIESKGLPLRGIRRLVIGDRQNSQPA